MTPRNLYILLLALSWLFVAFFVSAGIGAPWFIVGLVVFTALGIYDMYQKQDAVLRDYPVIGHMRYLFLSIAPNLHNYFVESNTDGRPFSKNMIALIKKRADNETAFHPFGTERDPYKENMPWVSHSLFPKVSQPVLHRVKIGGESCQQPYEAALLNVSAMSFGAISENAVRALNRGAKLGGFYQNTGEGGLTPYHLEEGGDIVLQIGTGNFGFRTEDGNFDPKAFKKRSEHEKVKMIEIKLSQGAKPGHGGMLPAEKNTEEIAKIRGVAPHTNVLSPPFNPAIHSADQLVDFIDNVRSLSQGKPVGIKLCIGNASEFEALLDTFIQRQKFPDFITVDAGEGGTGAAPLEYSNHVGVRGKDALRWVNNTLINKGIRSKLKIIYAGKVCSGFTLFEALCLGADLCNSARGFMFALGCIQSLRCHTDQCPTGVATQNKQLQKGLVTNVKYKKVANFQRNTIEDLQALMKTVGVPSLEALTPDLLHSDFKALHSEPELISHS
ncbi:MAG: FMN-binding glutamate synthase family protein [Endozoicomonas sp. (ex Botrylloides leachii)]|nr:FMN-binding glutamate synthase family protein [Endozoicomonas sp. (ex Botrylloides leachii)]